MMKVLALAIVLLQSHLALSFRSPLRMTRSFMMCSSSQNDVHVMVNGMPGPMATEVARSCINRGLKLTPFGFTGPNIPDKDVSIESEDKSIINVKLMKGLGTDEEALKMLKEAKKTYPKLIVIDFTHPSAVLNNVKAYVEANCDFVMGTTGFDCAAVNNILNNGKNYAVIAPNMAKQIVALQSAVQAASERFPLSFKNYKLNVVESHQSTKADTSGTAKAIVSHLTALNGEKNFETEDIQKIRVVNEQLDFGVPSDHLLGHAFHTYRLTSDDGSVVFELKHNVCGRTIYAEGTADAVSFLDSIRTTQPVKRIYNMIDVLESGKMK